MLGITDDEMHKPTRKRKKKGITFNDDEEVINPEDVDPSVGRFRNLVQTTVVPSKVYCIHIYTLLNNASACSSSSISFFSYNIRINFTDLSSNNRIILISYNIDCESIFLSY